MNEDVQISLKSVFHWLTKGIVFIIVAAVLMGAIFFAYSKYMITPTYQSTVKLCADSTDIDSQRISYYVAVAPQYVELLNVNEFYGMVADEMLEQYGKVRTAGQIGRSVAFSDVVEDTGVFYVTARSSDPTEAYQIAKAVADLAPTRIKDLKEGDKLLVASFPVEPSAPSSPNVLRNTAFGVLLGVLLMAAIIIAKELLDNRVKSSDQITEIYGLPILGSVPDFTAVEKKGGK